MAIRVPTLLATAVAAACSLSAHAEDLNKPATGCTPVRATAPAQDPYANVVLYADVTIAQDTVCDWGIWEQLEPTAAGPQTPLPLLAGAKDPYRPVGTVVTPALPPLSDKGVLMGFGVITFQSMSFSDEPTVQAEALVSIDEALPLLNMGFRLTTTEVAPTVSPAPEP